jgi:hypothetical protein
VTHRSVRILSRSLITTYQLTYTHLSFLHRLRGMDPFRVAPTIAWQHRVTQTHPVDTKEHVDGCPNMHARVMGNNCNLQYDGKLYARTPHGPWVALLPPVNPGTHSATMVELKVETPLDIP